MCLSVYFFWSVQTIFEQNKTENQFYWFFFWRLLNCYRFFWASKKKCVSTAWWNGFCGICTHYYYYYDFMPLFFPSCKLWCAFLQFGCFKNQNKTKKNVNTNEWMNKRTNEKKTKNEKTNHKFHSTVLKKRLLSHWNFCYLHLPSHNIEQQQQKHIWLYRLVNI